MGTARYILRIDKPLKDGKSPIDLIYQVTGQRKYYRTDKKLFPANWDAKLQNALYINRKAAKRLMPCIDYDLLPTAQDIIDVNLDLTLIKADSANIERNFQKNRLAYSSQMVIDKLKEKYNKITKKEVSSNMLFDFIDRYIKEHSLTRQAGSLSVYKSLKNHLNNYCKKTGKKVTFDNLDYTFFKAFQNYLVQDKTLPNGKVVKGLQNTTVAKQLSTIKTFINYAQMQGIEVSQGYKNFKIKKENLEVIALTNEEFESLFYMDLSDNKRLAEVRDVFCLSCVTGLRYSDLAQLNWEHIKEDEIAITVMKTKQPLNIPLNSFSKAILRRYKGKHKPLHIISNQNLNYAVKDLCKLAGINEQIEIVRFTGVKREAVTYPKYELVGVHNGRKTFASLSLEKGMSAEEVMSIGGWKDYQSFKRYVKVTEQRKKVVMLKAWDGFNQNKLKAV